jgi:hypothetical protein
MFSCWPSTTSRDWLRPYLFFWSRLEFIAGHPSLGVRYTATGFKLNRALDHPLAYRPQSNREPRMGANRVMNNAAVLPDRRHPNAQRLTDGTATLARTNQSDQSKLPGE